MQIDVMNGDANEVPPFASQSFWRLGGSSHGVKMLHTERCRYGKLVYGWAAGKTAPQLVDALCSSGAIAWHDACAYCAPNLKRAIAIARVGGDGRE